MVDVFKLASDTILNHLHEDTVYVAINGQAA
jgi:hypothetical protein